MYVIFTQPSARPSAWDLGSRELLGNIQAASYTACCLAGWDDPSDYDSAIRFNLEAWHHRTIALCYYGEVMCDWYLEGANAEHNKERVRKQRTNFTQIISEVEDDQSISMLMPTWTRNTEVLTAHRLYLIGLNPARYRPQYPELANYDPLVIPVPQGLHAYHI